MKTEIYAPDDGREASFAKRRHAISHRWIAFSGVGLLIAMSVLVRVPVRQAVTALPILTALMVCEHADGRCSHNDGKLAQQL